MTHPLTAAKVDKSATLPQRSAAASRNEMATDVAAASPSGLRWHFPEGGPQVETGFVRGQHQVSVYDDSAPSGSKLPCIVFDANEAGAEQRARLVVHAVNSYDDLRTANAELVEALKQLCTWVENDAEAAKGMSATRLAEALTKSYAALSRHREVPNG